ncbi:hypothetical protein [Pigmentiphaga daeguensis]|uniref:DUF551 domain-containing protein n=1 Tax=Pigmentiphaga daeguensis TaxID=414049 RepID=A0ABN1D0Z4_9BURK
MSNDDIKLPEPALYVGTRLFPYEQRMFSTPGLRERLGYDSATADYYTAEQLRAAVLADRASRAPSPQGDAGWMLIEEDAPIDVPLDTAVLLAWWDDWSEEWKIEANYAGSERGGWRHGRATHWMPLPAPPAARSTPAKGGEQK